MVFPFFNLSMIFHLFPLVFSLNQRSKYILRARKDSNLRLPDSKSGMLDRYTTRLYGKNKKTLTDLVIGKGFLCIHCSIGLHKSTLPDYGNTCHCLLIIRFEIVIKIFHYFMFHFLNSLRILSIYLCSFFPEKSTETTPLFVIFIFNFFIFYFYYRQVFLKLALFIKFLFATTSVGMTW